MRTELCIRKRIFSLLVILVVLFTLLGARLTALCTVESAALTQRGVRQWTRNGTIFAKRGQIVDTAGRTLVKSVTAFTVSADPRKVSDPAGLMAQIADVLGVDADKAAAKLKDKGKASVLLKRQVSREVVDALRQRQLAAGDASDLRALLFDEDVKRYYPNGAFLTQVLGLTNVDSVGQSGLEQQYETVLKGVSGRVVTSVDARERTLYDAESLYIEPQNGYSLKLTVDEGIQAVCEKAMRECIAVNNAQAVHVLVMDPQTGAILAMCSKPDYDPNDPPRSDLETLQSLMRIRLISDAYEPGSTFKLLTTAAALDSGVTTPEDRFYCSAKITVDGDTIKCWGRPHGAESMAEGLMNSCNPVFVELALRMGKERLYQYLQNFGLGQKTRVDLQGEGNGILIPLQSVKNVDLARIGFGQSVAVTPIQLLTAACAVVNGGRLMRPYIVREVLAPDGEVVERTPTKVVGHPISEETSQTMRQLLERVVAEGGAKNAAVAGYRIGGKTGTAQVYKDGRIVRNVHIGSFLGFAPADNPRVALLVIVDEANMPVDYGGTTAAPFARQILADVLPYIGCYPSGEDVHAGVPVPDVVGLSLRDAARALSASGLQAVNDGVDVTVTAQMPSAGASLPMGGRVMLYTYAREPEDDPAWVLVPDVRGQPIVAAGRMLRGSGLQLLIEGSGLAVRQRPAAGEFVQQNSVITVTFELSN